MKKSFLLFLAIITVSLLQAQVPSGQSRKILVNNLHKATWIENNQRPDIGDNPSQLWQLYKQQAEALSVKKVLDTLKYQTRLGAVWLDYEMSVHEYNSVWNSVRSTSYEFSGSGWDPYYKDEYVFTPGGLLTHEYSLDWNGSNWDTSYAVIRTYDGTGKLLTKTDYSSNGSGLEPSGAVLYTYDGSGRLQSEKHQSWDGTLWEDIYRIDFVYNTGGQLTADMYYMYNGTSWELFSKSEYTYDANGFVTLQLDTYWDGTQWVQDHKIEYTRKSNGDLLVETEYYTGMSGWDPAYKTEYTYDAADNISSYIDSDWNGSAWEPAEKYDMVHNNSFVTSDLVLPYLVQEDIIMFRHMLTMLTGSSHNGTGWDPEFRVNLLYSTHGSGIGFPENPEVRVSVFPNPASDRVTISTDMQGVSLVFQATDMQGRIIMEENFQESLQVSTSSWAGGLYFYRVLEGSETLGSGKLVVRP
jgi:hypothetical protein